jgi:ATP-binding cassette subfamily D (ALD) protein 3
MAPRRVRPRGAVSDFAEVVSKVAGDYVKDRRLCFSLALGATSLALFTAHQTSRPDIKEQFRAASAERAERRAASRARATTKRSKPAGDDVSRDASASCASSAAVSADGTSPMAVAVAEQRRKGEPRRRGAAVDAVFVKRLAFILRIVVPSITSKEAMLLAIQSTMLVTRSFISLRIAKKGGDGLQAVMERSWKKFFFVLGDFFVSGVSASVVNSALKYLTNSITVSFRERLTERVHREYLRDGAFYRAAVLRVGNLDNADQRIADDLHQFCHTASDLFARTFKPLLDVVLSTARMAENMGYGGLAVLYGYFVLSGALIKTLSPPFSEYIARTQRLEGDFRRAHSRLIAHAEEVAFLGGAETERFLLDARLRGVTSWSRFYHYLQFKQGVVDQYFIKYFASMIGWPVLAFPFLSDTSDRSAARVAALYRESDTLIQSASSSIGDLMMVYKKLQRLAGFTARVVELIEAVDGDRAQRAVANEALPLPLNAGTGASGAQPDSRIRSPSSPETANGSDFAFRNVTVYSPDGRLLVKDLDLVLRPGENLFVSGANGAGKTSLFRVLAGLWAPARGTVSRPAARAPGSVANAQSFATDFGVSKSVPSAPFLHDLDARVFYVPQRPYLAHGSLRDQVTYPEVVPREKADAALDARVLEALRTVNLLKLVGDDSAGGLDVTKHDWADVLSGGEKQRIGLARVFFREPTCAVLDEATSAVNPDEEALFYRKLATLGVTAFSIAHRPELLRFHHKKLTLHADGTGGWTLEDIPTNDIPRGDRDARRG